MDDIRACLQKGSPLLFDGAMGTCFAALPGQADQRCELANLTAPAEISAIHRAYLDAGCRAIKTNTFTAGVDLAQGREEAEELAVAISSRIAEEIAPHTDGLYLMTPFRRVALMTRILERLSR